MQRDHIVSFKIIKIFENIYVPRTRTIKVIQKGEYTSIITLGKIIHARETKNYKKIFNSRPSQKRKQQPITYPKTKKGGKE